MPTPRNDCDELRLALSYDDLKMNGMRKRRADFLQLSRDVDLQLLRLDDARPGNEEQRPVEADLESAQIHRAIRVEIRRDQLGDARLPLRLRARAAARAPP